MIAKRCTQTIGASHSSRGVTALIETLEERRLLSSVVSGGIQGSGNGGGPSPGSNPPVVVPVSNPIKGYGSTLHLQPGQSFSGYLGDLTGAGSLTSGLQLSAIVNWGDGSNTAQGAAIISKLGNVDISGRHTYAAAGDYSIGISVFATPKTIPGQPTPDFILLVGSITARATVVAPVNSQGGVTLHETAGVKFTASVGSFPLPPLAYFNGLAATIDWGDGQRSQGQILNGVAGTHTYASAGSYRIIARVYIVSVRPPGTMPPFPPTHPPVLFVTLDSTGIVAMP